MTPNQPDTASPRIDIHLGGGGVEIRQQRPAIARALLGLPVEAALTRIPTLLPICGAAQAVAAASAVSAARGQAPDEELQRHRDRDLWREQALASAWRLTVDWPALLGEARRMEALKQVYQAAGERECSATLGQLVPGLDALDSLADLQQWLRDSDSLAARVIRLARENEDIDSAPQPPATLLDTASWYRVACAALACEPFDALDPAGSPLEVGPLAMARDTLAGELRATMGSTVVSRLLAQLLDMRAIFRALDGRTASLNGPAWIQASARSLPANGGVGCAVTARGPVFHRVVLGPTADIVVDWRVLAPTDWHFGPRGPVAGKLATLPAPTQQRVA
ncbi:MAG: hypothetical protein KA137_11880, partial [Halioglobus sp.]|nr:hypothetical protein [Halioglobus sp.]